MTKYRGFQHTPAQKIPVDDTTQNEKKSQNTTYGPASTQGATTYATVEVLLKATTVRLESTGRSRVAAEATVGLDSFIAAVALIYNGRNKCREFESRRLHIGCFRVYPLDNILNACPLDRRSSGQWRGPRRPMLRSQRDSTNSEAFVFCLLLSTTTRPLSRPKHAVWWVVHICAIGGGCIDIIAGLYFDKKLSAGFRPTCVILDTIFWLSTKLAG